MRCRLFVAWLVLHSMPMAAFASTDAPFAAQAEGDSAEQVIVSLSLNDMAMGQFELILAGKDAWLPERDFTLLGIGSPPLQAIMERDGQSYVNLSKVSELLTFVVSLEDASIRIDVKPELMPARTYQLSRILKGTARERAAPFSLLLNYGVGGTWRNVALTSATTYQSAAVAIQGVRMEHAGQTFHTAVGSDYLRNYSRMVWEAPDQMLRVTLWDDTVDGAQFGMGGMIGGLSVRNDFSMNPYLVTEPTYDFSAAAAWRSHLTFLVNGRSMDRGALQPGPFTLKDLPLDTGSNDIAVLLADPRGREHLFEYHVFRGSGLLAPGLHRYSYQMGFPRGFSRDSFDYEDTPVFTGNHEFGFSNALTGGAHLELGEAGLVLAPRLRFALDPIGMLSVASALSHVHCATGVGVAASLGSVDSRGWPFSVGTSVSSSTLRNLTRSQATRTSAVRTVVVSGVPLSIGRALSIRVAHDWSERAGHALSTSVFAYFRVWQGGQLGASAQAGWLLGPDHWHGSLGINLTHTFSNGAMANYSAGISGASGGNPQVVQGIGISTPTSSPWNNGPSASVAMSMNGASFSSAALNAAWNTSLASFRGFSNTRDGRTFESGLSAEGSLVFVGGHFDLSRTAYQSFGLVRVTEDGKPVQNARVILNDSPIGLTGWTGTFFLPNLQPYMENRVRVEHADRMSGIIFVNTESVVVPRVREGVLFDIRVVQARGASGYLLIREGDRTRPMESIEFRLDDQEQSYPTAPNGEFYIDSVKVGSHIIRTAWKGKPCQATVSIGKTDDPFVDLGEVICEF